MERNTSPVLTQLCNGCGTVLPARRIPSRSGGDSQRGFEGPIGYGVTPTTRLAATAEAAQERRGTAMGDVDDDEGREDEYESESESNSEVQMRAEQGKSSLFSMGSGNLEAVVETERMSQELRIELVGLRECGLKPENGKQKDKLRGKGRRVERQERACCLAAWIPVARWWLRREREL
ncbi:hypothetical protein B0H19DRAFT_1239828 [Mycena capillaripes]|nr:hypothetical protein B0H19DRAFT_1239828 [Mycena capillaripes]